jgi:segregation and condensation protein A
MINQDHFILDHFEGSLDFLICLIQKEEIDIKKVTIQELLIQFNLYKAESKNPLDQGADFIGSIAYLLWLKSKRLLPQQELEVEDPHLLEDPRFEIIHHLADYCKFKAAAQGLSTLQEQQQGCYFRGVEPPELRKPLGIDHVSLEDLAHLFQQMLSRRSQEIGHIQEENWRVSDKISLIRKLIQTEEKCAFVSLFSNSQSRVEMIVIFLAILELIKIGDLGIGKESESATIVLFSKKGIPVNDRTI